MKWDHVGIVVLGAVGYLFCQSALSGCATTGSRLPSAVASSTPSPSGGGVGNTDGPHPPGFENYTQIQRPKVTRPALSRRSAIAGYTDTLTASEAWQGPDNQLLLIYPYEIDHKTLFQKNSNKRRICEAFGKKRAVTVEYEKLEAETIRYGSNFFGGFQIDCIFDPAMCHGDLATIGEQKVISLLECE